MKYLLSVSICLLASCGHLSLDNNFCDGWATDDGSGMSKAWTPNSEQMSKISDHLPPNQVFVCAEQNPSGAVTVISYGDGINGQTHYPINFQNSSTGLVFVGDEEVFVGTGS